MLTRMVLKIILLSILLLLDFSIGTDSQNAPSFSTLSAFSPSLDTVEPASFSFFNEFPHTFHAVVRFRSRYCEEDPSVLTGMEDPFPENCERVYDVLFDLDSTNARATLLHSEVGVNTSYVRRGDIEEDYEFQKICLEEGRMCKLFCSKSQTAYHLLDSVFDSGTTKREDTMQEQKKKKENSIPIEFNFPRILAADLVADDQSVSSRVLLGKESDWWKIQVSMSGDHVVGYDLFVRSDDSRVPVRLVSPDGVWDYLEFEIIDKDLEWAEKEVPFDEKRMSKKCVWTTKEEGFPRIHLMTDWIMI